MSRNEEKLPVYKPATDILEREDGFYVYMDVPGVAKDALGIDLDENELTVTATTRYAFGADEKFSELQFGNGEYRRSIQVSDIVDRERIKATLADGVLELFMPKVEAVKPRRIEIQQA